MKSRVYKIFVVLALMLSACLITTARTRTTQKGLQAGTQPVNVIVTDTLDCDTTLIDSHDIAINGYNKRASDSRETFFITNNTTHRISNLKILLRYYTVNDHRMLHQREVTIGQEFKPGETRQVSVTAWDRQHLFYFYAGPKPRKSSTPYSVAYRLNGYGIMVGK